MSYRGPDFLHTIHGHLNAHGYIDILSNVAIPSAHYLGYGDSYFSQDDGAPCHRARQVNVWKQEHDITDIGQWPPQSLDLNPIENLWYDLKCSVCDYRSRNLTELEANLRDAWDRIPVQRC
jgi:hypothetical protein